MSFRRDDGGFGSGLGGSFGTSYDPHREWDGPFTTRGVNRAGSRVPRPHPDEHPAGSIRYGVRSRPHLSEEMAMHQHGYGRSQYPESTFEEHDRGPHYGKGPKGYKRTDDRVREEVCEVMSRQGFIDASDVEVTVEGGVVRLVGTVASRADKRALEQMADRVHGVEEVRNEIRLKHLVREAPQPPPSNGRSAHS